MLPGWEDDVELMYNGPCMQRFALSMCCTFSITLFELNLGLYPVHLL